MTAGTSVEGQATKTWGNTAIATMTGGQQQHWWPWSNGFIYREPLLAKDGKQKEDRFDNKLWEGCDRDEWPPRAFWPGDEEAAKKNLVQRVRLLPGSENRGAGSVWKGFCEQHNAQSRQMKGRAMKDVIRSKYIRTTASQTSKEVVGGVTTVHTTATIETARAVFSIGDWDGTAKDTEDGLWENPCYPGQVGADPGWALLTDDEWYARPTNAKYRALTAEYRKVPDLEKVKVAAAANAGVNTKAAITFRRMDDFRKKYGGKENGALVSEQRMLAMQMGTGEGQIPADYFGQLPGIPKYTGQTKKRRLAANAAGNNTNVVEIGDGDWDGAGKPLERYSDEELDAWIEQYVKHALVADGHNSGTHPPFVDAVPTSAGHESPKSTAAAATAASTANFQLPHPTDAAADNPGWNF